MNKNIPNHIAFIPDGNRRWAKSHHLPTLMGHKKGLDTVVKVAREARKYGVKYFTIWFFSTENWNRDKKEIDYLMELALNKFEDIAKEIIEDEVKFAHLGRKDRIPKKLADAFISLEQRTKHFKKSFLNLAFDYGGRDEILMAVKEIVKEKVPVAKITKDLITSYLYTSDIPDPDLIIRTSGEQRLSGYLPWQGVYSELYFAKKHCPDFDFIELKKAMDEYAMRQRRFGGNG